MERNRLRDGLVGLPRIVGAVDRARGLFDKDLDRGIRRELSVCSRERRDVSEPFLAGLRRVGEVITDQRRARWGAAVDRVGDGVVIRIDRLELDHLRDADLKCQVLHLDEDGRSGPGASLRDDHKVHVHLRRGLSVRCSERDPNILTGEGRVRGPQKDACGGVDVGV